MNGLKRVICAATIFATTITLAYANDDDDDEDDEIEPYYELILMGGIATLDAENTHVRVTDTQSETLIQNNSGDWDSWTGRVGVGYVYGLTDESMQWFPTLSPQVNLIYLNGDISGKVYRFNEPNTNPADYDMNLKSTRLMFDLALTAVRIEALSIYAIGGAGVAWNKVHFDSRRNDDFHLTNKDLETEHSAGFAYEFGGGLTYSVGHRLAISAEYLYTGLTDVLLGANEFVEDADFDVNSQAVLVGFRFSFT